MVVIRAFFVPFAFNHDSKHGSENFEAPNHIALASGFGWIEGLLILWMPIYLLIMQKRVYAQGWPMTLLKYWLLGTCYTILLSFAIAASMAIGLVAM